MREFSEDRMSLYLSPVVAAMVNLLLPGAWCGSLQPRPNQGVTLRLQPHIPQRGLRSVPPV